MVFITKWVGFSGTKCPPRAQVSVITYTHDFIEAADPIRRKNLLHVAIKLRKKLAHFPEAVGEGWRQFISVVQGLGDILKPIFADEFSQPSWGALSLIDILPTPLFIS